MSVSNTCMRYSKQALVPIVSLVTLLLSSVVQLGSRAVSLTGKGTQTNFLSFLIFHVCGVAQFSSLKTIYF